MLPGNSFEFVHPQCCCCKLGNLTITFCYALVKVASARTAPGPAEWIPQRLKDQWRTKTMKTRVPSSPIPITTWSPVPRCLPSLDRLCDPVCWASSGTTLQMWWLAKTVANLQAFAGPRRSADLSFSLLSSCRVTPFWKFHQSGVQQNKQGLQV